LSTNKLKATRSKHDPEPVVTKETPSLRSRSHAQRTPDRRYRCLECGQISNTLLEQDAHHFMTHVRQPPMAYENFRPRAFGSF